MKQREDDKTLDLFGQLETRRGRPRKWANDAHKQWAYRQRKKPKPGPIS